MQPFGLLNFLKMALPTNEEGNSPSTTAETEETSGEKAENSSPTTSTFSSSSAQDAYCAFVDRHEKTAKKTRKK